MNVWPPKSRAKEYRDRAALARGQAEAMSDPDAKTAMLESASVWGRMADWEEKNPPEPD